MFKPVPTNLREFLAVTGWEDVPSAKLQRMNEAYRFFTNRVLVDELELISESGPEDQPGPFALKINGIHTGLCSWMQSIDFDRDVAVVNLEAGDTLRKFSFAKSTASAPEPHQHFYTDHQSRRSKLAIDPRQKTLQLVSVVAPTKSLRTTVGDIMVDWTNRKGQAPKEGAWVRNQHYFYRKGGAVQFFVPHPDIALKYT